MRSVKFDFQRFWDDNVHNSFQSMAMFPGVNCIELNQPALMVIKPGESFSIGCKITGYSASGGGCTNWIRHWNGLVGSVVLEIQSPVTQ